MFLNKKAFSLVEMLVVVIIISIIAGIGMPNIKRYMTSSKRNSIKPTLNYIVSLLDLKYIEGGRTFGGLIISDIKGSTLPGGYCIKVFTASNPQPEFSKTGTSTFGTCRKGIPSTCKTSSGYVIIAYGKKPHLDIGLSHEAKTSDGKQSFFLHGEEATCSRLKTTKTCPSYKNGDDCRNAGCRWLGNCL